MDRERISTRDLGTVQVWFLGDRRKRTRGKPGGLRVIERLDRKTESGPTTAGGRWGYGKGYQEKGKGWSGERRKAERGMHIEG